MLVELLDIEGAPSDDSFGLSLEESILLLLEPNDLLFLLFG